MERKDTRAQNTKRNIVMSYAYTVMTILFEFVSRTMIVHYLGSDYLGLSSLFASILQVLNMAELGFSGAIIFNMYKPLADGDTDTVCALLAYYKKIYRIVGMTIFPAGICMIPFLKYLIHSSVPAGTNLYVLYLLYLTNTCASYFLFAYKSALLEAIQRIDLVKVSYTLVNLSQYILQILSLVLFKNFYLFVAVQVVGTIFKNIITAIIAAKKYPQYHCRGEISTYVKQDIITRVKGLMVCRISGVTYTTFDSIIMSAFLGLSSVAIYNNYITVYTGVTTFVGLIRSAMQASVGNSVAKESIEKNYNDMLLWQFLFSVITTICVSCMLCLYQPFMELWMGRDMLLPMSDVVLICAWFAVTVVQHSYFLYLSGNGMWWEMRWPYICSTVCNLVMNIVLGKLFGITGIIFSSFFSSLVFCFIWQSSILFKYYFRHSFVEFLKRQGLYFCVLAIAAGISYCLCALVTLSGIGGLLIKGFIAGLASGTITLAAFCRTDIFQRSVQFLIHALKSK